MAIALRFNFFVARKASIEAKYSGGVEQFRTDWMKPTRRQMRLQEQYGEDDHLIGFYSMGGYLAEVVEKLKVHGLQHRSGDLLIDFACGDEASGFENGCDWLEVTDWDGQFENRDGFRICWLKGSARGEIVEAFFPIDTYRSENAAEKSTAAEVKCEDMPQAMIVGIGEMEKKESPCCGMVAQYVTELSHVYQFDLDLYQCGQCGRYWVRAWRMGIGGWEETTAEDAEKMRALGDRELRAFMKEWAQFLN